MEYLLADWLYPIADLAIGLILGLAIGLIVCKCVHEDTAAWYKERLEYFQKRERELTEQLALGNSSDIIFDNQGGWKVVPKENEHCAKS